MAKQPVAVKTAPAFDWSEDAMRLRNFLHYHKNRIFRASKGNLHVFPDRVRPDEDETSAEKSITILKQFGEYGK